MKVTTLRLPETLHADIEDEAADRDMAVSEYVREILRNRKPNTEYATEYVGEYVGEHTAEYATVDELAALRDRVDELEERLPDDAGEPDSRTRSSPPEPRGSRGHEAIDSALQAWKDGNTEKDQLMRESGREILTYVRDRGPVQRADFHAHVYPEIETGANFDSWWERWALQGALTAGREAGLVEKDGHTWVWAG